MGYIKINKVKCLHCGEILYSSSDNPDEVHKCGCGKVEIFGGESLMGRKGVENVDYKEMSEFDLSNYSGKISEEIADEPPGNEELIQQILNERK